MKVKSNFQPISRQSGKL